MTGCKFIISSTIMRLFVRLTYQITKNHARRAQREANHREEAYASKSHFYYLRGTRKRKTFSIRSELNQPLAESTYPSEFVGRPLCVVRNPLRYHCEILLRLASAC
jgi:hypothetical protein